MSRSLCIQTHDQLILPILGLILTSSSRAQSTIYFCTLSIRLLINSTLKNTTLTRHLLATLEFVKWSLKKFNGWLKPPLPTVKMFIVVTDVKKERKISMCANLLRPEISLDRIVSLVDRIVSRFGSWLIYVSFEEKRPKWIFFITKGETFELFCNVLPLGSH